jgi:AcrR family transcriptional regulator
MSTAVVDLPARLRAVPRPKPVLDRRRERSLTTRQRELLDQLGGLFDDGFARLTMAEIAAELSCSLRTLYELAPSRDELLLIVIDRNLWRIGRTAVGALDPSMAPLDALRAYLDAATMAVVGTTPAFARDLAAVPAAQALNDAHSDYLVAVSRCLLDAAVERGDIEPVDTAAIARVMAGVGRDFTRPEVLTTLQSPPKEAADTVVDVILRGLRRAHVELSPEPDERVRREARGRELLEVLELASQFPARHDPLLVGPVFGRPEERSNP